MPRCAIYIRESTERQSEGFSPDMQERALRRYAQDHGYSIAPEHVFVDYESGRTDRRDRFQELLEAAERQEFEAILIYHTSRFARNIADARRIKTHLRRRLGIKVISVTQSYDPETPWGRLTEGVFELFDENYSDQLSFWITQALKERYQQGELNGRIPIGYKTELQPDGSRRTVPDPHYAPMVRDGFRLYATGEYSYDALGAWSSSKGYLTHKGLPLNRYSWETILKNPAYIGYVSYKRRQGGGRHDTEGHELLKGNFEPLVSPDVFAKVQELRRVRATRPELKAGRTYHVYILSGLARCEVCGGHLRGEVHHGQRYMADYGDRKNAPCGQPRVKAEVLEAQVLGYLGAVKVDSARQARLIRALKAEAGENDVEDRRSRLERSLRRLREAFLIDDTMTQEEYKERVRSIKLELSHLQETDIAVDLTRAGHYLQHFDELVAKAPAADCRDLVHQILQGVLVRDGQVTWLDPKPSYLPLLALDSMSRDVAPQSQTHNSSHTRRRVQTTADVGSAGFEPATNRL